jgi:hypothetical protein
MTLGCGGSPASPSSSSSDLVLSGFTVNTSAGFAGLGPLYTVCGNMGPPAKATEETIVYGMTVSIRDSSGREILNWEDASLKRIAPGGGIGGCFGSHSDPDRTRAPGADFRVRVTYSLGNGASRAVEVSGPVMAR